MRNRSRLLLLLVLLVTRPASALDITMPAHPIREALSETVPTGFSPGDISEKDYRIEWNGDAPEDLTVEFVPGSVEWSRVSDALLIPRVRLRLRSSAPHAVLAQVDSIQTLLPVKGAGVHGDVLVALSGNQEITLKSGERTHAFRLRYAPADQKARIFTDHTCSSFRLRAGVSRPEKPFWVWIGCRAVHSGSRETRRQLVELYIVTDAGPAELKQGTLPLRPIAPGLTTLRLDPSRQTYSFQTANGVFTVAEAAASDIPYGFIGMGIGPYQYTFQAPGVDLRRTVPVGTIYGSYALTDAIRLTAFNATVIHRQFMTDSGVYFNSESFRALDRRISFHLMLGMNAMGVRLGDSPKFKLGAPQGFEATWRDFLKRNYSLNGGAFIYPKINNTAYYNLWARYGSRGFFFEVNYLNIRNEIDGSPFFSKAIGLSLGAPLFRFY